MALKAAAARAQAGAVRPVVAPVPAVKRQARQLSSAAQAFVSQAGGAARQQEAQEKSFLDVAISTVMSLFDDSKQEAQASEELQLPPELQAYLDEIEAHDSGSHGGWVHSHIAERLASSDASE